MRLSKSSDLSQYIDRSIDATSAAACDVSRRTVLTSNDAQCLYTIVLSSLSRDILAPSLRSYEWYYLVLSGRRRDVIGGGRNSILVDTRNFPPIRLFNSI